MKQFLGLFIVAFSLIACSNEEKFDGEINAKHLVRVLEDNSVVSFKKLVDQAGYSEGDSSIEADGSIIYSTTQLGLEGNLLGATTINSQIDIVHFSTYDEGVYKRLKEQIVKLGFRSQGVKANPESEDFEKGNILINTSFSPDVKPNPYEFNLYRGN